MQIKWDEDICVGNAYIDGHHKKIIEIAEEISAASSEGRDLVIGCSIPDLLGELEAHFAEEEAIMRRMEYSRLATHKAEHDAILKAMSHITETNHGSNAAKDFSVTLIFMWAVSHIKKSDHMLAKFIRDQSGH
jgi:hemerythrin-like metal-binding protein